MLRSGWLPSSVYWTFALLLVGLLAAREILDALPDHSNHGTVGGWRKFLNRLTAVLLSLFGLYVLIQIITLTKSILTTA